MSEHLKTQEMCDEAVHINPLSLAYVSAHFKTQGMCNEAVKNKLRMLLFVPDHFWAQEICNEIMRTMPDAFHRIPDRFNTQKMCKKAVEEGSGLLEYVPDWFVKREWMWMWYEDYYDDDSDHWSHDDEDKFFEWYEGHKKCKSQKVKIKEELLPIAWYPSRYWDWCMSEDEKKMIEAL